ncbi:filamentous hemagglutinin [Ectopseudomonas mendocina DLHK]|nr:filamentous hemagglutinin [Pseudomonas mendocina DLHK]
MDVRSPLFQNIALIVAGVLFLNPIVATAAQLAVDQAGGGNTAVTQAGNGVPVVNIATPNGSGLSHNKFTDYNVGQQGLILNNASDKLQSTQLGGIIIGNSNLKNGAAGLILNEVTGGNASQLKGYTEVAGRSAAVIVANPHGITCDGCGFINTPRVTLSTGTPVIENGRLQRFDVDGGQIAIEGQGLNAGNVDQFDLITRSAKINAELHANKLNIITGRNEVDASTLAATAKADDGSNKPMLAIDSSALGGMYAGAIRLVGTEQGVGVKLAGDMATSAGDIQIDANGKLSLAQTSASGNLALKAGDVELTGKTYAGGKADVSAQNQLRVQQSLAAAGNVNLRGAQVLNQGVIEAGVRPDNSRTSADLSISAQQVRNAGTLIGNRQLQVNVSQTLDNQGGTLSGKTLTRVDAAQLDNRRGRVLGDTAVSVAAGGVDNRGGQVSAKSLDLAVRDGGALDNRQGMLFAEQRLGVSAGSLDNSGKGTLASQGSLSVTLSGHLDNHDQGTLTSQGAQSISAATVDNSSDGLLSSRSSLSLNRAATNNQGGRILADGALSLSQGSLDNQGGTLSGKSRVDLNLSSLDNRNQGGVSAGGALTLNVGNLDNRNQGQVSAKGDLEAKVGTLKQAGGGELLSQGRLTLDATRIDNRQGGLIAASSGLQIDVREALLNAGGEISTPGQALIRVQAGGGQPDAVLDNSGAGLIVGDKGLELYVQRLLNNAKGVLSGRDGLKLVGGSLDNSAGGTLSSRQAVGVQLSGALDNHDQGGLLSGGSLLLEAASIDNRAGGLLSSGSALSVAGGSLDNQGGRLVSDGRLSIQSASLDNGNAGVISAGQALSIDTGRLDNHSQGLITASAGLSLSAGQLNNHDRGVIAAKGAVDITASGLDQHDGGELVSETALSLDLQGGDLDNSGQGLIATPGALLLNNLGRVDNSAGGEISSGQGFLLAATELNNGAGRIISSQALQLQITQKLLNNLKGALSAARLTVAAASLDNSGAGMLVSQGDLALSLGGKLDNHDQGLISAGQALDIHSAELDNSADGLLASGGALQLSTGTLDNRGGSIASQGALNASSAGLDNRGGVISSRQALSLTAAAVDNRAGGLITSADALSLEADSLDSSQGGELSAKGDLYLKVGRLIQQQGLLIGEAGVRLDLQGGDLDNRAGLLSAKGPLTLDNLGKLDNRGGELSSNQGYRLVADAIDNGDQGRLLSAAALDIDLGGGALRNADGGLISGWQGLKIEAGSLDNRAGGTLSSRDGDLGVALGGALDNSGEGALVSKGLMSVSAASLDNSGKGILSSAADLELSLAGTLNNSSSGLIDSQGALGVSAGAVDNRGGQIASQQAASLTATSLDNNAGQLSSNAALSLTLTGNLLNTQQAKLASAGPLVLKAAAIDNLGGSLISQNLLQLTAASLNNAGGTLAARNGLDLLLSGALNNSASGLIHSQQGTVEIQAQSLNNQGGALSAQQDLTLGLSGLLDNRSGHIQSVNGNLDLHQSGAVDNTGGVLSSLKGWLKLFSTGLFDNDSGTTQAQALAITAKGVDNRGGHLSALAGDSHITATGATFNNQGGGLYAQQTLQVSAADFNNQGASQGQGGKVAGGRIDFGLSGALNNRFGLIESDSTLSLDASGFGNSGGSLRSLGTAGTTSIRGGLLDNQGGLIETANTALQLDVSGLQNAGGIIRHVGTGTFGLSSANVMAAGGSLSSNGVLGINASSWVNSSVLQAGTLNLNIGTFTQTASGQLLASQALIGSGGSWTNNGLLASDGTLSLTLSGGYGGPGRVTSLGNLSLSAASIDLPMDARISGGGLTSVTSTGQLNNRGRLTSAGDLTVRAGTLNNYGTLGSAEQLKLYAPTLLNENGLIFSGGDMALRVNAFTNKYADVYSLGGLSIAKDDQLARSSSVENVSATLESAGHMQIRAQRLENRTDVFSLGRELISGYIAIRCYDCSGDHYNVDYIAKEFYEGGVLDESPAAFITAGGNFSFVGGDLFNRQSSISAAGNITIQATNFSNIGALGGSIERTRIYNTGRVTDGTVQRFVSDYVTPYNQRNNPDFPNAYYADGNGKVRLAIARLVELPAGKGEVRSEVRFYDAQTNEWVRSYFGSFGWQLPSSKYDPNNLLQLPSELAARYTLVSDTEVALGGGEIRNAIVQAGGNVSIQASQTLENSVIRNDYQASAGTSRVGATSAQGTGKTTVFVLNAQLPPDLQQRQINPLSLPGFVLPQGENGLFRLSSQAGRTANASATQGAAGGSSLAASAVNVGAGQSAQGPAAVSGSAWSLQGGQGSVGVTSPAAGSLSVAGIQSLPSNAAPSVSHKYLIETNPALTELKQFMGSDYLLGNLGFDPDKAQLRLGDGLYEQRLIREAVVARTGQRYLAGLTSDEAMYRYLMDNAIASKERLGLSLGVSLSAAQVAALTHDIVWLEEHEVLGEKVLVPVLYLAQAEGRLAANGALIQGRDVTLISGGDLINQGTLRASESLSAVAGGSLVNSGLVEASERLQLLATESIRNAQGGIIAGRDVSLTALSGDVINERSVTRHEVTAGNRHLIQDFVDSAARIEAANSLRIDAGRDIANLGGVLDSRGDLSLSAGRDVTIASVEERVSQARGSHYLDERVSQIGAQVSAGGDLDIGAGRDLAVIASRVQADGDVALAAGNDVLIASAANESHYLSKSKKVIRQKDHIEQQSSEILAGGDVAISAANDLLLSASKVQAGDEAYLVAGQHLALLSAEDYDYSLYQKKKKGSFGRKSFKRDEVTQLTHVGSEVSAGGDVTLLSGSDQLYQAAKLESGGDLTLASGGAITFEGVKDLEQESHEKSKSSFAWQSAKGKGKTDETLRQSQLIAQGDIVIKAVDGLKIDIKQVNQQSVSQTIDAMVKADPQLAWLKEAEARGDVDWRRVKEIHDSFKYSSSGLGAGAQLVIAIVMAAFVGPAASAAVGGGAVGAAVGAVSTAAATNATISTINNRGDLGAVFKDVTSSDALKSYVISGVTAGLTQGYFNEWTGTTTDPITGKINVDLGSLKGVGQFAASQALQNGTAAAMSKVLGQEGDFGQALKNSLFNTIAAASFNMVGDYTQGVFDSGTPAKVLIHAVVGGLLMEAVGGDFKTGALAAGVNEATVAKLDQLLGGNAILLDMTSQLVGLLAAASLDDADANSLQNGAWVARNATQYNHDMHKENAESFTKAVLDLCTKQPGRCSSDISQLSEQDLMLALAVTAAHGEGIERVNPDALRLVNQFLTDPDLGERLRSDIFSPTESEQQRLDTFEKVELAALGISAAAAAKAVLTGGVGLLSKITGLFKGEGAKGLEIAPGKFDYMFGRVASNSHNAARSNQLALEMKRLGVPDNASGRQMLTEHLALSAKTEGNVVNTFTNQFGKFEVRESLFMGPSGKAANFQSTFQVLEDGTRKLSTIIPIH